MIMIKHNIISRSAKKLEQENAHKVLEKAKSINRNIVFLKQGDGSFSRSLQNNNDNVEMLNTRESAAYLSVAYHSFVRRVVKARVPYTTKNKTHKLYKVEDLEKYKEKLQNA